MFVRVADLQMNQLLFCTQHNILLDDIMVKTHSNLM